MPQTLNLVAVSGSGNLAARVDALHA